MPDPCTLTERTAVLSGIFCASGLDPVTPIGRAAVVTWLFAHGRRMSAHEVAELVGIKDRRARSLLEELSLWIPIYRCDDGRWALCT